MLNLEFKCNEGNICQIGMIFYDLEINIRRYWKELELSVCQ